MTKKTDTQIISAIHQSAEELHQRIDMHRRMVASVLENRAIEQMPQDGVKSRLQQPREENLKQAIMETIEVLEESRKAFKSKRLEALRKKLTVVLINNP